jgi:hypothetical protein
MKQHQRHRPTHFLKRPAVYHDQGQVVNALLLLEIISSPGSRGTGFLQLATLNRSTCDSSDRQLYALGAATLVFCIPWIRRMAALVTDVPAIHMSDHGTRLKA